MKGSPHQSVTVPFHVMAKPIGPICNLDCEYCYYLSKKELYPGGHFRMGGEVLDEYLKQVIGFHPEASEVTLSWQGGEPTLMGLPFFELAMKRAEQYRRPGQRFIHTIQTNGTLITEEWARFFRTYDFLVGISIDGPKHHHDTYRVDKQQNPTWRNVMKGLRILQEFGVRVNVLCTVNARNADYPLEIYRFLRDECAVEFVQFIPIVERTHGSSVSDRSVTAMQWGHFLLTVFNEWVRRDVGRVYIQIFEEALAAWMEIPSSMCIFSPTCGSAMALEHNGDVYSCDHYVDESHRLGNILREPLHKLVNLPQQTAFGQEKLSLLPADCRNCDVRFACHGECPKNRFITTPSGEPGLNYLCDGYKEFFHGIDWAMRLMSDAIRENKMPSEVMTKLNATGRNERCPCGSGVKFKKCHGQL